MNTRLTRRQTSLDDRATLVLHRYSQVNAPIRTNGKGQKLFVNVIYGKQSLTEVGPVSTPANAALPIDRARPLRIEPPNDDPRRATAEDPVASSTGRRR